MVKTSHEEVREASPGRGVGQGQGGRPGGGGGRVGVCPCPWLPSAPSRVRQGVHSGRAGSVPSPVALPSTWPALMPHLRAEAAGEQGGFRYQLEGGAERARLGLHLPWWEVRSQTPAQAGLQGRSHN